MEAKVSPLFYLDGEVSDCGKHGVISGEQVAIYTAESEKDATALDFLEKCRSLQREYERNSVGKA